MKIIDAHIHFQPANTHFARIAQVAGHENSEAHLAGTFEKMQIERAVVMGNRGLSPHAYPDFLRYCVGIDQEALTGDPREAADKAECHLRNKHCVGIKLYAGYCPYELADPVYRPFYELAGQYRKPVAVHTGVTASSRAKLKYSHPLLLDDVATDYPQIQFVMCHIGNPWLADAAAVLEKNDNVAADLSGLLAGHLDLSAYLREQSGYVRLLRTWISYVEDYDKFLYGTDWPLVNMAEYAGFIAQLIPERHHEKVFYQNARRVYAL